MITWQEWGYIIGGVSVRQCPVQLSAAKSTERN